MVTRKLQSSLCAWLYIPTDSGAVLGVRLLIMTHHWIHADILNRLREVTSLTVLGRRYQSLRQAELRENTLYLG